MTKEEMQAEYDKLIALFGTAIFNRVLWLNAEIQKAKSREAMQQQLVPKEEPTTK